MSDLIVLKFEGTETAIDLREALKLLERDGLIEVEDAAIVSREADGTIRQRNEVSRTTKMGVFGGAAVGLFVGFIFLPLAGIAVGAAGGALVGSMLDRGVGPAFVKEVGNLLQPGESALFVVARNMNRDAAMATLRRYQGRVYHTTL